ncbi:MAG TPA: hypothetical protein VJM34_01440 [Novosphingobium sp.]|nr:hypothetical protein [Novosphingobium sp.]
MPEIYGDTLSSAFRDLVIGFVIFMAYSLAKDASDKKGRLIALRSGAGWCVGIALAGALLLGQPSCATYDDDPIRGSCVDYREDGFVPSTDQRLAKFLRYSLLLFVPVIFGVMNGGKNKVNPWRRPEAKG